MWSTEVDQTPSVVGASFPSFEKRQEDGKQDEDFTLPNIYAFHPVIFPHTLHRAIVISSIACSWLHSCALDGTYLLSPFRFWLALIPPPSASVSSYSNSPFTQATNECIDIPSHLTTEQGRLWTWGCGQYGALGHGDASNEPHPRAVESLGGVRLTRVSAGVWHTAIVCEAGGVYTMGWNKHGQVSLTNDGSLPLLFLSPPSCTLSYQPSFSCFSSTYNLHVHLLLSQLGIGSDCALSLLPSLVDFSEQPDPENAENEDSIEYDIVDVVCGARHNLALTETGQVWAWGSNRFSQISTNDQETDQDLYTPHLLSLPPHERVVSIHTGHWSSFIVYE